MPDFAQTGLITTLHDLGTTNRDRLEQLLVEATVDYKIGLVLPVTASDMRAAPFAQIIQQLQGADLHRHDCRRLGSRPRPEGLRRDRSDCRSTGQPRPRYCGPMVPISPTVPTAERRGFSIVGSGQGPIGVDSLRLSAGRPTIEGHCPARLRYCELRSHNLGSTLPADGPPQSRFRVLQGLSTLGVPIACMAASSVCWSRRCCGRLMSIGWRRSFSDDTWRVFAIRFPASLP